MCSSVCIDVSTIPIRRYFSKPGRREAHQVPLSGLHSCRCQNSGQPTPNSNKHYSTDWGWTHPGSRAWHPHSLNLTCELSVSTLQDSCRVSWRGMQLSNSGGAVVTGPPPPCRQKTKMTCNWKWSAYSHFLFRVDILCQTSRIWKWTETHTYWRYTHSVLGWGVQVNLVLCLKFPYMDNSIQRSSFTISNYYLGH